jgi:hypothetical protein
MRQYMTPINGYIIIIVIIFSGSAAQSGLWPPRHSRFLDHTRRVTVGRTPLGREISSSQRPLHDNTHNRQLSIPPVGFEPTITVGERP